MSIVSAATSITNGKGHPNFDLTPTDLREILSEALATILPGSSVLAIVADKTRDDNTDVLLPLVSQILANRKIRKFDALIAQGTHAPMTNHEKRIKIGAVGKIRMLGLGHVFDHDWADHQKLVTIGVLNAHE